MADQSQKLAASLEALEKLQADGVFAIKSSQLSRTHRERLVANGFLKLVMKGWYIASRPDERQGESTAWYTSFWDFVRQYLTERFGDSWSLSPEQSLSFHAGSRSVPDQLIVRAPAARNQTTRFPHETSIFEVKSAIASDDDLIIIDGIRLFTIDAALIDASENYYRAHAVDARTILASIPDASALLAKLLTDGRARAAGRLAGAFRNIGSERIADNILSAMKAAMHDVRESDPFERVIGVAGAGRLVSPHVNRIRIMWSEMRDDLEGLLPPVRPAPNDIDAYISSVEAQYVTDAYHSLSIEGYRVSRELIERVRSGAWNPVDDAEDQEHRNALAARGYWQAFQVVKATIRKVLEGTPPGEACDEDLPGWYQQLFAPSVAAGIVEAARLAGYRNGPVYIRQSKHVPMSVEAVRDCMPEFFDLLKAEQDPAARIILGHFVFVFIHPYFDGNGRTARFLMNVMMAAAGLPWTVIRLEQRDDYMTALEQASVEGDIKPFARLVSAAITDQRN
jgi:hypothetical protein